MKQSSDSELFALFWENSKFTAANIGEFQRRIETYSGTEHDLAALQYPHQDVVLPTPRDKQYKQMLRRHSSRRFSTKPLSDGQLGSLLSAFHRSETGGRTYASAGATYPLEIFCLINNHEGELKRKVAYYNVDNHSLSVIGDLPAWDDYKDWLNIDTEETIPQVVFIFTLFADRALMKYGERGGRFALIEVGEALQSLSLRLVEEKLAGCATGGLLDDRIKSLLGLEGSEALMALGFVCGRPVTTK
jgi:SagB-type dehydrogenase family enzyme